MSVFVSFDDDDVFVLQVNSIVIVFGSFIRCSVCLFQLNRSLRLLWSFLLVHFVGYFLCFECTFVLRVSRLTVLSFIHSIHFVSFRSLMGLNWFALVRLGSFLLLLFFVSSFPVFFFIFHFSLSHLLYISLALASTILCHTECWHWICVFFHHNSV